MKPRLRTLRAVTAEYVIQSTQSLGWIIAAISVGLVVLISLVMYFFSAWWGLFMIPIVLISVALLIAWRLTRLIAHKTAPAMSTAERELVKQFVIKAVTVTEGLQTPYFIVIFYIARDVLVKRNQSYLERLITDSRSLKPDFDQLHKQLNRIS